MLLVCRPDAPELTDEEAAELQDRHLAFRADLRDRGYLAGGRPLVDQDDERLRGISIMACDPEKARRLCNEDPGVQAGRLAVEVMTLDGSGGQRPLPERADAAIDGRGRGRLASCARARGSLGPPVEVEVGGLSTWTAQVHRFG